MVGLLCQFSSSAYANHEYPIDRMDSVMYVDYHINEANLTINSREMKVILLHSFHAFPDHLMSHLILMNNSSTFVGYLSKMGILYPCLYYVLVRQAKIKVELV